VSKAVRPLLVFGWRTERNTLSVDAGAQAREEEVPMDHERKYEPPALTVLGSVVELTETEVAFNSITEPSCTAHLVP